jgi:hypothetical protein
MQKNLFLDPKFTNFMTMLLTYYIDGPLVSPESYLSFDYVSSAIACQQTASGGVIVSPTCQLGKEPIKALE